MIQSAMSLTLRAQHASAGLWVGEVTLNAVNEATGAVGDSNTYEFNDPEVPTATSDAAYLRLILHVDGAGKVSLLKSVAIVVDENSGETLLITDPTLYASYPGVAKRIASAFYDFSDENGLTKNTQELNGELEFQKTVSGEISLAASAPTNPFMHKQHPDHVVGYDIRRVITMNVDDLSLAGYGVSKLSGVYQEEIFGLHKPLGADKDVGLKTKGTFTLNRISTISKLNQ